MNSTQIFTLLIMANAISLSLLMYYMRFSSQIKADNSNLKIENKNLRIIALTRLQVMESKIQSVLAA